MAAETIGDRRRQTALEQGRAQQVAFAYRQDRLTPQNNIKSATHLYHSPLIPDRLSGLPVGRHRPEYISAQGETPRYMFSDRTSTVDFVHSAVTPPTGDRLPPILPIRSLPQRFPTPLPESAAVATPPLSRRVPFEALQEEIPDFETSVPLWGTEPVNPLIQTSQSPTSLRAPEIRPAAPSLAKATLVAEPETVNPTSLRAPEVRPAAPGLAKATLVAEPELAPALEPVIRPQIPYPRSKSGHVPHGQTRVAEPTTPPAELRSARETGIHKSKRRRKIPHKLLAAVAVVAVSGAALVSGGLAILKRISSPQPDKRSIELILPATETPPPLEPDPPIIIQITEAGIISTQQGNQWNAAADKTSAALGHSSNAVTNIVAKVGAYDSQVTSPDPDDADTGDSFTMLTESAIEVVDRLRQPLEPTASQAEIDAARIIYTLNSLNPMETQALIAQYGSQIEALKADLIAILTPHQKMNQNVSAAVSEKDTPTASPKATTVFAPVFTADQVKSLRSGKKAIAGLARDHHRRQRQSSFA